MLKEDYHCIFSSVILTDSALKRVKNYYLQVFLEECKYIVKKKRQENTLMTMCKLLLMVLVKTFLVKDSLVYK